MKLIGELFSDLLGKFIDSLFGHTYVFRNYDGDTLFKIRVPRSLHKAVAEAAINEGVSIEQVVLRAIRRVELLLDA